MLIYSETYHACKRFELLSFCSDSFRRFFIGKPEIKWFCIACTSNWFMLSKCIATFGIVKWLPSVVEHDFFLFNASWKLFVRSILFVKQLKTWFFYQLKFNTLIIKIICDIFLVICEIFLHARFSYIDPNNNPGKIDFDSFIINYNKLK